MEADIIYLIKVDFHKFVIVISATRNIFSFPLNIDMGLDVEQVDEKNQQWNSSDWKCQNELDQRTIFYSLLWVMDNGRGAPLNRNDTFK